MLVVPVRKGYSGITIDLGLLHIYSALKAKGIVSTIMHCPKDGITEEKFREILQANLHIKTIGFKMFSVDHNSVKRMSLIAKQVLPECVTVAGGPHPTCLPEYILEDMPGIDYVFRGEGEAGFPVFCEKVLAGKPLLEAPNIAYRREKGVVQNKCVAVDELDRLPRIQWEDVSIEDYPDFLTSLPFIPVMATRGCPFQCKYCAAHSIVGRKMRYRSVENVIDELRFLKETHKIEGFNFSDDELTLNRNYFIDLCKGLIKSGLNLKWECSNGVRLDTLDDEVLDIMYKAGCRYISVGIESGNNRILKSMKKNISTEVIREKVAMVKRSKVVPQGLFMVGFPDETEEDIRKTIDFAIELDIDKTNFSIFMPLPGSEIFDELVAGGALEIDRINWDDMKPDKVIFRNSLVSPEKLKQLQRYAYMKFYLRLKPLKRLFREFVLKKRGGRALFVKLKSVLSS
ncbi:MAG: radical SAM protein [Nitrospirae bacterium]|nr:radical SAM protein [Nitrospirota bacterium]